MCSQQATVYVECEGVEAIAGIAQETRIQIAQDFYYTVKAPKGADVYVYAPADNWHKPTGEVFTNIDRKPTESGTMLEVTKALRLFNIERQQERREHQRRMAEYRKVSKPKEAEPEPIPASDPVQDDQIDPGKDQIVPETDT